MGGKVFLFLYRDGGVIGFSWTVASSIQCCGTSNCCAGKLELINVLTSFISVGASNKRLTGLGLDCLAYMKGREGYKGRKWGVFGHRATTGIDLRFLRGHISCFLLWEGVPVALIISLRAELSRLNTQDMEGGGRGT